MTNPDYQSEQTLLKSVDYLNTIQKEMKFSRKSKIYIINLILN